MRNLTDVISGILVLLICGIGFYSISSLPEPVGMDLYGPASFPKMILYLLAFCGVLLVIKGARKQEVKDYWKDAPVLKKLALFIVLFCVYVYSIIFLSDFSLTLVDIYIPPGVIFSSTTFLFLIIAFPLLGRKKILQNIFASLITTIVLYVVFGILFKVLLP